MKTIIVKLFSKVCHCRQEQQLLKDNELNQSQGPSAQLKGTLIATISKSYLQTDVNNNYTYHMKEIKPKWFIVSEHADVFGVV